MELTGKLAVVTGGGNGIGAALARRFHDEGARLVVVVDVDGDAAGAVADDVGGIAVHADLGTAAGNRAMIEEALAHGPIDLLCCNAGIAAAGGVEASDEDWQRSWDVNVMAHVWAVRAALPSMLERGEGHILTTASAAGLLTNLGTAPYSVTKHAAVALAEWLAITHGDEGIGVSCLCPQGVRTDMLFPPEASGDELTLKAVRAARVLDPDDVAAAVVAGLRDERFLILPHEEVQGYVEHRATDREGWLAAMRRFQAKLRD
jgi:NAD(P)-dependent dehydrogenase (short-subunit alcohol dehydrogenase family)